MDCFLGHFCRKCYKNPERIQKAKCEMDMTEKDAKLPLDTALSYLGADTVYRINGFLSSRGTSKTDVNEIRLRASGPLSLVVSGRNYSLGICIGKDEITEVFRRVCDGAVFKHRDDVCRGSLTLGGGIRVGVAGHARYEGGSLVGIADISVLVFRIPSGKCSFALRLLRDWRSLCGGMLVCSAAGEGKTTAIRALAGLIGSGRDPKRVVVVDERCEFFDDYSGSQVDVLRGYKRSVGVEIAIRTLSAEVLIVDEISSREDSFAMLGALGAGVSVIATVHARSLADAVKREYIRELVTGGLFRGACVIHRGPSGFDYTVKRIGESEDDEKAFHSLLDNGSSAENSHGMGDICYF